MFLICFKSVTGFNGSISAHRSMKIYVLSPKIEICSFGLNDGIYLCGPLSNMNAHGHK